MTSFTSRYGNPAVDYKGAHIWAYTRHTATVVAVGGRVDAANVDRVIDAATRFVGADAPFVLDLSTVIAFTPAALDLVTEVDEFCGKAGVDWALVAGSAVARRLADNRSANGYPVVGSVAEAEHHFDDAISRRRRMVLPLLSHTA